MAPFLGHFSFCAVFPKPVNSSTNEGKKGTNKKPQQWETEQFRDLGRKLVWWWWGWVSAKVTTSSPDPGSGETGLASVQIVSFLSEHKGQGDERKDPADHYWTCDVDQKQ